MKTYTLIYEGRVREVYTVEANSKDEALEAWGDYGPDYSEAFGGEIVSIEEEA